MYIGRTKTNISYSSPQIVELKNNILDKELEIALLNKDIV
jgi:hypothetical protein